ncbi:MAG: hypothetical protein R3B84_07730 [Zavarzinella sp.]
MEKFISIVNQNDLHQTPLSVGKLAEILQDSIDLPTSPLLIAELSEAIFHFLYEESANGILARHEFVPCCQKFLRQFQQFKMADSVVGAINNFFLRNSSDSIEVQLGSLHQIGVVQIEHWDSPEQPIGCLLEEIHLLNEVTSDKLKQPHCWLVDFQEHSLEKIHQLVNVTQPLELHISSDFDTESSLFEGPDNFPRSFHEQWDIIQHFLQPKNRIRWVVPPVEKQEIARIIAYHFPHIQNLWWDFSANWNSDQYPDATPNVIVGRIKIDLAKLINFTSTDNFSYFLNKLSSVLQLCAAEIARRAKLQQPGLQNKKGYVGVLELWHSDVVLEKFHDIPVEELLQHLQVSLNHFLQQNLAVPLRLRMCQQKKLENHEEIAQLPWRLGMLSRFFPTWSQLILQLTPNLVSNQQALLQLLEQLEQDKLSLVQFRTSN